MKNSNSLFLKKIKGFITKSRIFLFGINGVSPAMLPIYLKVKGWKMPQNIYHAGMVAGWAVMFSGVLAISFTLFITGAAFTWMCANLWSLENWHKAGDRTIGWVSS